MTKKNEENNTNEKIQLVQDCCDFLRRQVKVE